MILNRKIKNKAEWLPAMAAASEYVNDVAARHDLAARIQDGEEVAFGHPAVYVRKTREVEVNTDICLRNTDPQTVNFRDPIWKKKHPSFVGVLAHEAGHARFTEEVADYEEFAKENPRDFALGRILEESRMEKKLFRARPETQEYVRATVGEHILREAHTVNPDKFAMSMNAALILGRSTEDGGCLPAEDIEKYQEMLGEALTADEIAGLRGLWQRYQDAPVVTRELIEEISREWHDIIQVDPDETAGKFGEEGEGEGQEGDGNGDGGFGDLMSEIAGELSADDVDAESDMSYDARKAQAIQNREDAKGDAKRRDENEKVAKKIFHGEGNTSDGHVRRKWLPEANERALAVKLSKSLDKVTYHDVVKTDFDQIVPPGRFQARRAVQAKAEAMRGGTVTTKPFVGTKVTHTDQVPVNVGIMVDISGSMGGAEKPLAVTSWVVSEATRRVQGKVGTVLFGAEVHGVVAPGARQQEIVQYAAMDGFEAFEDGFKALDGSMNLLDSPGARILVIASDGQLVSGGHARYCEKAMRWCKNKGVAVVWLDFTRSFSHNHGFGQVVPCYGKNDAQIVEEIGQAILTAVSRAEGAGQ